MHSTRPQQLHKTQVGQQATPPPPSHTNTPAAASHSGGRAQRTPTAAARGTGWTARATQQCRAPPLAAGAVRVPGHKQTVRRKTAAMAALVLVPQQHSQSQAVVQTVLVVVAARKRPRQHRPRHVGPAHLEAIDVLLTGAAGPSVAAAAAAAAAGVGAGVAEVVRVNRAGSGAVHAGRGGCLSPQLAAAAADIAAPVLSSLFLLPAAAAAA
eukprot:scaffold87075_cov18-Tisochrysis_lutea.AAC.1